MLSTKLRHPESTIFPKVVLLLFPIVCLAILCEPNARAVPSYARQTGYPCASCHYAPPELTPLGRQFKLDGYTLTSKPEITDDKKDRKSGLQLLEAFPLSVQFLSSFTTTKSPQPGTQNGNFEFPQQASLFLAGSWAEHVGSFVQVTYSAQGDHFSWDNTDIRYANGNRQLFGKSLTYGVTFNNNPTVEDLWNSTPAWGFPFVASDVAPTPSATPLINGGLAQDVAGFGGYAMWNNHLYVATAAYRSEHLGGPQPIPDAPNNPFPINISGVAPYWRVAWQTSTTNNNIEVGTYGIHLKSYPSAVTGPTDSFTDWAIDFQYDRTIPEFKNDVLSFRGTYIRENSSLVATVPTQPGNHLNYVQANVEYHFGNQLTGTGAFFNTTGTHNPLLYAPAPVSGSASGSPSSTGYILDVSWWPIQNIKLAVQYTGYTRFNGAGTNYDGSGRKASANNSTFLAAYFVF